MIVDIVTKNRNKDWCTNTDWGSIDAVSNNGGNDVTEVKYQALYDYDTEEPESLSFKSGDIILVNPNDPTDPGWLIGNLNGKVGWVPDNYVTLFDELASREPFHIEKSTEGIDTDNLRNDHENGVIKYKALYDYDGDEPESLAFKLGDIIHVNPNDEVDSGWLKGSLEGKSGWVPDNFVTLFDATSSNELISTNKDADPSTREILRNTETANVIVPYSKLNSMGTNSMENLMDAMNRRDSELGNQIKDCILIALFIFVFGIILGKAGF